MLPKWLMFWKKKEEAVEPTSDGEMWFDEALDFAPDSYRDLDSTDEELYEVIEELVAGEAEEEAKKEAVRAHLKAFDDTFSGVRESHEDVSPSAEARKTNTIGDLIKQQMRNEGGEA